MKKLIFIFACLFWAVPSQARIITIDDNGPADFNNIQAAINDANDGDTIIVADGTYTGPSNREIDFKGKAITLRSQNGPENCIINCQRSGRGFYFHSGETAQSILSGFTVMNGLANGGGGAILCQSSSSPTIEKNLLQSNSAPEGGAITCRGSSPTILSNIIKDNEAFAHGEIPGFGGGMFFSFSSAFVANNLITSNWVTGRGGGLFSDQSQLIFRNNIITGNAAHSNTGFFPSAGWGGGISCERSTIVITNNTISGNRANGISYPPYLPGEGGGIQCGGSHLYLTNTTLWYNSPDEIHPYSTTIEASYSDIAGGWAGIGNIVADPCFADPGHWIYDPFDDFWVNGDYHLKSQAGRWDPSSQTWVLDDVTSSCIDAGNPGCPLGDEPNEPNNVRINMGAYGGTAEASKSPANWRSIADMTNDWVVNSNDLKVFVDYWMQTGECIPSDLNRSQSVDFNDFAIFGLQWSYPSSTVPGMTFHVDDCNSEAGLNWPVAAESNEPRFSVWVEGRYIYFKDQMYANCCPGELGLDNQINGNEITLYEIGYGGMCLCMCYFPITATLGPFEDGTYNVEVYDNYGNSLGVVEVTIGGTPEPGMTFQIGECGHFLATEQASETRFTVTVEGRHVHFEDTMYANCCPDELELEMTIEDNLITIYETEYTSGGCRCHCPFPITARLGPFESGTYTLEVYEDGAFIGSTTIVIDPPP
jgi:hypothetical protein